MNIEIGKDREHRIVAYLKKYIELCQKHKMYITGSIGADTSLWDVRENDGMYTFMRKLENAGKYYRTDGDLFNEELGYKINEIIYGGLGGNGLFADDGNHCPPKTQLDRIMGKLSESLKIKEF